MEGITKETRTLALTPTWSVATVLTVFVAVSLIVERSIHRLCHWLRETKQKPLLATVEKMKEELMLLGFMSLLLTATTNSISSICISSKFYSTTFTPCARPEVNEETEENHSKERNLLMFSVLHHPLRRIFESSGVNENGCKEGHVPLVSYEGLEQLHRFIFIMAITHISYSCLTMLLAILKVLSWRAWEEEVHIDHHDRLAEITREQTLRRQTAYVSYHRSNPLAQNNVLIWMTCFFRQFGRSVVRTDYLTLRNGFIMNHNLSPKYDFHNYMIRSMEDEFQRIVGLSAPLWGFVVAFMLFNIQGSNLYFWIAIIPFTLVLFIGAKLQRIMTTLTLESAGITGYFAGAKLKPRDDLFWWNKPGLLQSLLHFVIFQNAFELASYFWCWWQFGYDSCFISNHVLLYMRLILGFAGQFLCSYSTLPSYALVTQMGTNYKAALIPPRIRETIHGWKKSVKKKRKNRIFMDESTIQTDTSTVISLEEDEHGMIDVPEIAVTTGNGIELQRVSYPINRPALCPNENSSRVGTPFLRQSTSMSSLMNSHLSSEVNSRLPSFPSRRGK